MKHKHSPNFFENLQEADTANNNRATTFFWTVVLITILMLGLSVTKTKAQIATDTIYITPTYRIGGKNVSKEHFYKVVKFGDTLSALIPYTNKIPVDTIPVAILITDTSMSSHPYTIEGYQTEIGEAIYYNKQDGWKVTQKKTIYLNDKKQPLPDRLIVWMAIRRKER